MKIKIKKLHPDAKLPVQGTVDAAGFDLFCTKTVIIENGETVKIPTGIAMEIPQGYCGVVYSRSSSALKNLVITPLIVDADYRGEIMIIVKHVCEMNDWREIKAGDRIAQIKIEKLEPTEFEWAEELNQTERGAGGYGSTGR